MDPFQDELHRIADRLYRIGLGFCGNHADAQDLVQETLIRAYRNRDRFEGRSDIHTWLYRIASRVCVRMRRRRAGQPARMESIEEDPAFGERMIVDLDELARRQADLQSDADLLDQLKDAITKLPEPFRIVLVLKEIGGLSVDETARVLGIKPQTVKTRLHRARMKIRSRLAKNLPSKPGVAPLYSRQICLDLLKAKQSALDRGEPFPIQDSLMCERCRSVFSTLDMGQELCRRLAEQPSPTILKEFIRRIHECPDEPNSRRLKA